MSGAGRIVDRRVRSKRMALAVIAAIYAIASAVALVMLLFLNIDRTMFFTTWPFWRFFLTVINVPVAVFFFYFAATAYADAVARPSLFATVVGFVHFVWCFIVIVFTILDYVNCPTTTWCAVPPALTADVYFVIWTVGFFTAAVFEFIACILSAQLYALVREQHILLKQAIVGTTGYASGTGYAGTGYAGTGYAANAPLSTPDAGLLEAEYAPVGAALEAQPARGLVHPIAPTQIVFSGNTARFSAPQKESGDPHLLGAEVIRALQPSFARPPIIGARKQE